MLGLVMAERFGVAVAGTHGKSTTAAMISFALRQCGLDPSYVIGGSVPQLGGGSHSGTGDSFIVEACEYDRSFLNLQPRVAAITNIEEDHLDYYKDIDDIVQAFAEFAARTAVNGLVIANGQDRRVATALAGCNSAIQTVGLGDAGCDFTTEVAGVEANGYLGHVRFRGRTLGTLRLSVPGRHNLFNATMALAACMACGADAATALAGLNTFSGVDRRMTEMGRCNGAILVDDYGHHPTEIQATLTALREKYHPSRLFCVFQPHQHSRTRFLMEDFAISFTLATETIVPDIYFVRDSETDRHAVSADDLVERIVGNGQRAQHLPGFDRIAEYLRSEAREGDLILTMGAGNVWEIARALGSA